MLEVAGMSLRIVVVLAAALCTVAPALAREPALSPARERQKRCGMEWRALSAADKAAKGPAWPQFYSKCVKRLKGPEGRVGR